MNLGSRIRTMGVNMFRRILFAGLAWASALCLSCAPAPPPPSAATTSPQAGVGNLKTQMTELREQLAHVLDRIDKLEKK